MFSAWEITRSTIKEPRKITMSHKANNGHSIAQSTHRNSLCFFVFVLFLRIDVDADAVASLSIIKMSNYCVEKKNKKMREWIEIMQAKNDRTAATRSMKFNLKWIKNEMKKKYSDFTIFSGASISLKALLDLINN